MEYSVGNKFLYITFDDEKSNIISLKNTLTWDNYLKKPFYNSLFKIFCLSQKINLKEEFLPGDIEEIKIMEDTGSQKLVISFKNILSKSKKDHVDIKVKITIEILKDDWETLWYIHIDNRSSKYKVVEILFPYIKGIYLGDNWEDDYIIFPHHAGEKTKNPVKEYTSERFKNFWRAQTLQEDNLFYREINYCGLASMDWMYYYDFENGFYISSYDDKFLVTGLRVETGGPKDPWMGFSFRKYKLISPDEKWHSSPYAIAITNKDWHWGAKRYRRWIDKFIKIQENPSYLKDEYELNQCYNFKRDGVIYNRFENIPSMFKEGQKFFGMKHMFIASWNRMGFDQNYPEYHPDMELGTPWELYQGCSYVNKNGGFVTFYINSRLFHIESDFFETLGKKWAIKNEGKEMIFEQYGPHKFVVNCPSNRDWQKFLIDMACWLVKSYGIKGVYLDQLGSAEPFPCYDESHSHQEIGEFNQGYLKVLEEIITKIREINPDTFLIIENCGDIYSGYVWGNLTWNGDPYDEFFNLFKYTFPEYTQIHMVNPKRDLQGRERTERLYRDIARAILLGAVFWLGMDKVKENDNDLIIFLKKAVLFRKKINSFIKEGIYVDDEDLLTVPERIDIAHWKLNNRQDLFIISNPEKLDSKFFEFRFEEVTSLDAYYSDIEGNEEKVNCNASNRKLKIMVPKERISYILLPPRRK